MFTHSDPVITEILNPLNIKKSSVMEFSIGELAGTGLYRFTKIIEFTIGDKAYARYLLYSKADDTEYVFEVFPLNSGQVEAYLYSLTDTVPFSEEFLQVAGQRYLNTPQGFEYKRCIMPGEEDRIDGVAGSVKIYDIEAGRIEKEYEVQLWEYVREFEGKTEYLNVEMSEDTGMFRIFTGELVESIFYKVY